MKTYEYTAVSSCDFTSSDLVRRLNEAGQQGFRLVSSDEWRLVLMRENEASDE